MQTSLRPKTFEEFIGQDKLKQVIEVMIISAKKQKKTIDHILFHGKPGIGKTSLAEIIAKELGSKIRHAQGPTLEKKADLLSLFGSVVKGDVIFIDEIHGISKNIEELMYSALEDGVIDIIIGPEGDSKIVRLKLPSFTLIGATTKLGSVSAPLKDRFGILGKLRPYSEIEIDMIVIQSARTLKWRINKSSSKLISAYSRNTPRIANNFLKRVIDFAIVGGFKAINDEVVLKTFEYLGIYKFGLTEQHVLYLKCLNDVFNEKPASLDSLIGVLGETKENIEVDIEPILLTHHLIERTSRGRRLTNKGIKYITTYNLI